MKSRVKLAVVTAVGAIALLPTGAARAEQLDINRFDVNMTENPVDLLSYAADAKFTPGTEDDPENAVPLTQAGSHASMNVRVDLCSSSPVPDVIWTTPGKPSFYNCTETQRGIDARDFKLTLARGMVGNPEAATTCDDATFNALDDVPFYVDQCPPSSMVGYVSAIGALPFDLGPSGPFDYEAYARGFLFNLEPIGNEPARLGAVIYPPALKPVLLPAFASVATESDYSISTLQRDQPSDLEGGDGTTVPFKLSGFELSVFGHAGDPSHTEIDHPSFLTLPTSCDPTDFKAALNSWDDPQFIERTVPFTPTGCDSNTPDFTPTVKMTPDDSKAGAPSGQTVTIGFPNSEDDEIHQSHLKAADVTLPKGIALSPGAAIGLDSCSDAQFGKGSTSEVTCPPESRIGDVSVETPVLDGDMGTDARDPLEGKVYFGQPKPNDQWRIFMLIEDAGLRIKLEGSAKIDDNSGQIRTVFENLPTVPFTKFDFHLNGGDKAILTNPRDCGDYSISSSLKPWNSAHADATPSDQFTISGDGHGAPCGARGFAPSFGSQSSTTKAGANVKSHLTFTRPDGQQLMKKLDVALPPGLIGSLTAAPLCPLGVAKAAACDESSEVGTVATSVGSGGSPLTLPGKVYIAEPSEPGDAATLAIIVPSKVGPIDLGKVIVLTRVKLRQADGAIVTSSELPTIYKGVPLSVRKIDLDISRDGFLQNQTGCDTRRFTVDFTPDEGAVSTTGADSTATGCDELPFAPTLSLRAGGKGATDRFKHTPLHAVVTQTAGQSAIHQAYVLLPNSIKPDTVNLNKPGALCNDEQLNANACPAASLVGNASASSPALPNPLTGPIYIVQSQLGQLPKLAVLLNGAVALTLIADNSIEKLRVANRFNNVPDNPLTRFELNIAGGSNGILKNGADLCTAKDKGDATFTAHSGKTHSFNPGLDVDGCGPTIKGSSVTLSKFGIASVKVQCNGDDDCSGTLGLSSSTKAAKKRKKRKKLGRIGTKKFSIANGKTATVKVKISKKARRTVAKKRKIKVSATLSAVKASSNDSVVKTLTIKAPKKNKKKRR